jgi:hypothetical protein
MRGARSTQTCPAMSTKDQKEWRPDTPCDFAPLFVPAKWGLANFYNYFFGYPGFFAPWNIIYFVTCETSYHI